MFNETNSFKLEIFQSTLECVRFYNSYTFNTWYRNIRNLTLKSLINVSKFIYFKEWLLKKLMSNGMSFSPTILRVVRVVRVGRILRLIKGAKGLRTLLFALIISMPALLNIGLLLFLVIFIYAIFGMNFFMYVKYDDTITEFFNFQTIYRSILLLFPMCTFSGWNDMLESLSNEEAPDCDPDLSTYSQVSKGDCGNRKIAIPYLISYLVISFSIVNMFIAVLLENFDQAREEIKQGLTNDDFDMCYKVWQKFDPKGTEFIPYERLSDFVNQLAKPLRIPKPNKLKLINMDIIICKDGMVHYSDVLFSITKNYLGAGNEVDELVPVDFQKKNLQTINQSHLPLNFKKKIKVL